MTKKTHKAHAPSVLTTAVTQEQQRAKDAVYIFWNALEIKVFHGPTDTLIDSGVLFETVW